MPEPATLKIREIFWSAQGEGSRVGFSTIFIRLSGCFLRCPFCDTKDSWREGTEMTVAEILTRVDALRSEKPYSQIVITGGEPLEQDLGELAAALTGKKLPLAIETNGMHFQDLPIAWWSVSPKEASGYLIHPGLLGRISEIKLVATPGLTLERIAAIRAISPTLPIFLQPQHPDPEALPRAWALFGECQTRRIPHVRLGFQLHRLYGVD